MTDYVDVIDGEITLSYVIDIDTDVDTIDIDCEIENRLDGDCELVDRLDGIVEKVVQIASGNAYSGAYEVTPTTETIKLSTYQKLMKADVVVNPIPSNYGLITWTGAVLTVT